jgi:electron transfer flavoprotein alpha subunit
MSRILIVAEHDGNTLNQSTAKCLSCAQSVGADCIDIAILSDQIDTLADQAAKLSGVSRVVTVERPENRHGLAAILGPQIAELAAEYDYVFAPSTTFGKDVTPRVAAILGVGQISDIMSVEGPRTFKRPIYAGNAIVTVEAPADKIIVATVRVASYRAAESGGSANIESVTLNAALPGHTRFRELKTDRGDRPDLQAANVVISGGRGVGSAENFELLYALADKLAAGVGASRAAVDAGYVPNDMQVGQTGKIISPDLYFAFGISGAIQHLTGIKDAGTIVAVNKDPEAPIFEISDIGLVGDLFNVVPELLKQFDD